MPSIRRLLIKLHSGMSLDCPGCGAALALLLFAATTLATSGGPSASENLALHKPATASSIENDDQNAAKANDGDDDTRWCADDEPENGAEWWQVDLQKPADLSSCQIEFPYEGKLYRYKVEGSGDGKTWTMLSDQSQTTVRTRLHTLSFNRAAGIRFVKITILAFDEGCWASISEVKIYGQETANGK
jgi:alpha-L-fucosidase